MVSTEQADERAEARDETFAEAPHRHRPVTYGPAYTEGGFTWVDPVCECGIALTRRRASSVKRASA